MVGPVSVGLEGRTLARLEGRHRTVAGVALALESIVVAGLAGLLAARDRSLGE